MTNLQYLFFIQFCFPNNFLYIVYYLIVVIVYYRYVLNKHKLS